jgi:hypothetical protein
VSTILDALRKAHAARGVDPAGARSETPLVRDEPAPRAPDAVPAEPSPVAPVAPAIASPAESPTPTPTPPPAPTPEPPSLRSPEETPGSFPEDPPSYLPPEDDSGSRRRFVTRAAAVVAVGVLLGLLVGRRFTSTPDGDDLLSDASIRTAAVEKPVAVAKPKPSTEPKPGAAAKPAVPATAPAPAAAVANPDVVSVPPPATGEVKPVAKAAPPPEVGATAKSEGDTSTAAKVDSEADEKKSDADGKGPRAEKGARGEKKRRSGAADEDGRNAAQNVAKDAPIAALPKPAPVPQQALPAAPMMPVPKAVAPLPEAPPSPPPPVELPPPPDDAPALSLLFIQWSADAAKRVASLRQNEGGAVYIVREGDVVQGLRIAAIRPSALEIQWRGQYFLLPAARY